ncbi:hypothetical protein [Muricomes intestini]|jgi:hypothetical protein|uniref:hypothetical protein n=1 Tax=Muricomes intestini TaxID=1796634 RepID=UPI002FE24CFE
MNKEQILLHTYIKQAAKRYIDFMEIEKLPQFGIVEKVISLSSVDKRGFGSYATHHYDILTGTHTLIVWPGICQLHAEYLLFHEFTHILDTDMYVQKDKMKNAMYKGFSEYHAGQIDFLKVLGVKKIDPSISFSMNQIVDTVENTKAAEEYVIKSHDVSTNLINRSDFPADVETLAITVGLIFNYWGRRSICKMYAVDYVESVDNTAIEKFIGKDLFRALDTFMNGWLEEEQIKIIADFYFKMMVSKTKEYSL